ncbi:MAG TPA: PQQ-dependent sugar dehydrogenase [Polyangiaceae bacterium]|nr:PQQ-dependent sugar dehydrogenase [Polyangiaceae bacterium]
MMCLSYRSSKRLSALALIASIASACGDDDANDAAGGSGGGTGVAGSGGSSGSAGASGSAGSGGSPVSVEPDPLKDCGVAASPAVPELRLEQVVTGLEQPIYVTQVRGDAARLFVVEKPGRIRVVRDGALVAAPFLSIGAVSDRGQEMGLLGLAFHPDYSNNGRFYVYYSTIINGTHFSRIAEYRVSSGSPDVADAASERVLLEVQQPEDNHNGGNLEFGPDGYLYIGLGDGGGGGDQHGSTGNGQNLGTLLGKILRIDVDGMGAGPLQAYAIPNGNAAIDGALPEIWSYGLRNPWRYSFDPCTGDMYIGDVGQGEIEEVDFEPAGVSGRNYGWRLMEGDSCFNPNNGCNAATQNLVLPVAQYDHDTGQSITGGYVYRGPAIPNLRGTYLYADFQSARFFALRMAGGSVAQQQVEITDNINPGGDVEAISSFGQDSAGEVYVVSFNGSVYRIVPE